MIRRMRRHAQGFSLLEMAVALMVMGSLTAGVLGVMTLTTQRSNYNEAAAVIQRAEQALLSFVEENWRLPCPDTSRGSDFIDLGVGLENCGAEAVGQLPFRTLGLSEPVLDPWRRPLAYAVDTRFTSATAAQEYRYRLCQALQQRSRTVNQNYLHSLQGGTTSTNLAYALVSGGGRDASGDGSRIDQLLEFGNTYQLRIDDYQGAGVSGDQYTAVSLYALAGRLRCPGEMVAVNSLENEVIAARLTRQNLALSVDIAQGNIDGVSRQITLASLQIVQGSVGVASAAASLINAIGQGLVGNVPALISAGAAVASAAAAVVAIVAAAIDLDEAINAIPDMEERLEILESYLADALRVCEGARALVIELKGSSQSCE
jgi:prepilin-type N-terminal cleavage/methylation domain-containing protein